jgi:hypothetical protein
MIGSQAQIATSDIVVSTADSADNVDIVDVIGGKTDTWQGDSLYALHLITAVRYHAETLVYPTLASGAAIVSDVGVWTWGAYATIVPASTITVAYHMLAIQVESCDQNGVFELEIYQGAADDLIAAFRLVVEGGFFGNVRYELSAEPTAANSRIRARMAGGNGIVTNATLSVEYNVFPT